MWRIALSASEAQLAAFEAALADGAIALSNFEAGDDWTVEALTAAEPDAAALEARVMVAAAALGVAPPAIVIEPVPETDWLAATRAAFPPIRAGRYTVHGSHLPPSGGGPIDLEVDAGPAFGSGEHETTRGCLLALDRLARRHSVRRALDLGCGTGILALAIAKTWRADVVAADIDAVAVRTARENARLNGVAGLVRVTASDGMRAAPLRRGAPYDLIAANILARPLIAFAPGLAARLAPGGVVVLSGLLARQERAVLAAYRARRLALIERIALAGWHTLVLARPSHHGQVRHGEAVDRGTPRAQGGTGVGDGGAS